jgi:hypothetical protein
LGAGSSREHAVRAGGLSGARKEPIGGFLRAGIAIHVPNPRRTLRMATKAEQIYGEINELVTSGVSKAIAFKRLAEEYSQPVDSIRGAYYGYKRKIEGGTTTPRTRRRETTPEDALADARASLERSIAAIDKEVEAAKARASEAAAEYEAIRGSAEERKKTIAARLDALK